MELVCAGCLKKYNLIGPPGKQFRCQCGNKLTIPKAPPKEQFGVVQCSGCWTRYSVAGRKSGAKFRCRTCGNIVTIRNTGTTAPEPPVSPVSDFDEAQTQIIPLEEIRRAQEAQPKKTSPRPARAARPASGRRAAPVGKPRPSARPGAKPVSSSAKPPGNSQTAAGAPSGAPPAALRQEVEDLKRRVSDLASRLEDVSRRKDELEQVLKEKDALLAAKDSETKSLHERIASLEQEKVTVTGRFDEAQKEIASLRETRASLENSLEEKEKENASLRSEVERLNTVVSDLNRELAERVSREEMEQFRKEKAETESLVSGIASELAGTREALRNILGKANALVEEISSLENGDGRFDKIPDVLAELDRERELARRKTEENEELKRRLEQVSSRLSETRGQLEEILREHEKAGDTSTGIASKLLGIFGRRSKTDDLSAGETVKAVRPGHPRGNTRVSAGEAGDDVVQPEEVADLGEDLPEPTDATAAPPPVLLPDDNGLAALDAAQQAALADDDVTSPLLEAVSRDDVPDVFDAPPADAPKRSPVKKKRRRSRLERYR